MDVVGESRPLAAFSEHSSELVSQVMLTKRPLTLTLDGEPAVVVQDAADYLRLLDLAAAASEEEWIRQGLADIEAGRVCLAQDVFDELRAEYGISR